MNIRFLENLATYYFLLEKPKLGVLLYKKMMLARIFEQSLMTLEKKKELDWPVYVSKGQEACGVGVATAASAQDLLLLPMNYRASSYIVGRGIDLKKYIQTIFFRSSIQQKNQLLERGFMPYSHILGAHFSLAVGRGLALKQRKERGVCISIFGDGTSSRGTFHSALNLSMIWRLPILWICENNYYSVSSPLPTHSAISAIYKRATGYGMKGIAVDGNNVVMVYRTIKKALEAIRSDNKPMLLELKTYRIGGHVSMDDATYRNKKEREYWGKKDPIKRLERWLLILRILDKNAFQQIRKEVISRVETSLRQ